MKPPPRTNQRRTRTPFLALSMVLVVATAACGGGWDATGNPLEGSRWEMTAVSDGTGLVSADPTTIATLQFSDGAASGSTGCNLYQAPYTINSDSITFGDLARTGSACDPDYSEQGGAFIRAMQAAERYVLSEDSLELTDAAGAAQIVFRPATELPLTWVAWQLVWFGEGTSPLEGTQISLTFRDDGTLTGIAGCNSYSADYQTDGDQLAIGAIARTEMACTDRNGVMIQETDYLNALAQAAAFTTTLTGLELHNADASPVAEYGFGGRIRDDIPGATDGGHDLEQAAFIGPTRDAAIQLRIGSVSSWGGARQWSCGCESCIGSHYGGIKSVGELDVGGVHQLLFGTGRCRVAVIPVTHT